jgi:peptidoglycan/xylan/chitin deacetylase (PgdA/CDA1 family)
MSDQPALLVGIDTEGDNQWDLTAREQQTFENIYALPKLHALFERHGVRPTYVVTWPVATDERSQQVLRYLLLRGDCEVGAHHHAWETPPCEPGDIRRHPYASTLPPGQFEAQLRELTRAIASATGEAPVSYRSGRFGFDASHVAALEHEGYLVESSVAPLFYEAHKGGPDFVEAPLRPYFLSYDSAVRAGTSRLLEVPCSSMLSRDVPQTLAWAFARAPFNYTSKRVLRKLGVAQVDWLRPSYSSVESMCALARRIVAADVPVLNLLFHSSEAIVGGSPYNRTQGELDAFLDRLDRFLDFATRELGARPATFREFHAQFTTPRLPGAAVHG